MIKIDKDNIYKKKVYEQLEKKCFNCPLNDYETIKKRIDIAWYKKEYPTYKEYNNDPILHYFFVGRKNKYYLNEKEKLDNEFDKDWYYKEYHETKSYNIKEIEHYNIFGKANSKYINEKEKIENDLLKEIKNSINFNQNIKEIKAINKFCEIYQSKNYNSELSLDDLNNKSDTILQVIIYASKAFFSENILNCLTSFADKKYIDFTFLLNISIKKEKNINDKLKKFNKNKKILFTKRKISLLSLLKKTFQNQKSKYIVFFTLKDSFCAEQFFDKVIPFLEDSKFDILLINKTYNQFLKDLLKNQSINCLSGVIFSRKFFLNIIEKFDPTFDFYIPFLISTFVDKILIKEIFVNDIDIALSEFNDFTIDDIAFFIKNSVCILNNFSEKNKIIDIILSFIKIIIENCQLSKISYCIFCSGLAILCSYIYKLNTEEYFRQIVLKISVIINSEKNLKEDLSHLVNRIIQEKIFNVDKNSIGIIETDYLTDLNECLVEKIKKYFDIVYVKKPQFYDYNLFFCMCLRSIIQPCRYLIVSNDTHKYITDGKYVIMAWHGLGLLKSIKKNDYSVFPKNIIITSSKYCVTHWSKIFNLDEKKILPFGNLLSDLLYEKKFIKENNLRVREKYNIPKNSKIIFFAPTFRNYNLDDNLIFKNICKLKYELERNNTFLLIKFHHIIKDLSIYKNNNIIFKQYYSSRFIKIIDDLTFIQLLCSCNYFMTDYSSGIFYAIILNLPLILYAEDIDNYKKINGDFLIDYPNDIPGIYLDKFNNINLNKVLLQATRCVNSPKYINFKKNMVSECNGFARDKFMNFLLR